MREDRCQLEAADSDTALVMTGGGLMTAIALQGLRQQWDAPAFERLVEAVTVALTPMAHRTCHSVQFVLERDPDRTVGRWNACCFRYGARRGAWAWRWMNCWTITGIAFGNLRQ